MAEESFSWVSLEDDEKVRWQGQPRIHSIISALIVGVPLVLFFGIGLIIIAAAYLHIKNTDFVVTNENLYKKTGVLSRNVQKIGLDKIQNISFSQGILGTQFGYGNVEISTAGGSGIEMKFNSIKDPKEVQELINRQVKDSSRAGKQSSELTEKELLKQILDELGQIRENLEEN